MKRIITFLWAVACIGTLGAAQTEEQAIAALQSSTGAQKEAAILRLKEIGSSRSVPALKALLTDENFAQWAVDALETMPVPEAGKALIESLPTVSGKTKAMVLFALGARQEKAAGKLLRDALTDADALIAVAAAQALGNFDDKEAIAALSKAHTYANLTVARAASGALLTIADRFLAKGETNSANRIYIDAHRNARTPEGRAASFRGSVLCADRLQAEQVALVLGGSDPVEQVVAIQLVRELPGKSVAAVVAAALPKMSPIVQIAVLEALRQRNDPAAAPAVSALTRSGEAAVRVAALKTLGELGDASSVPLLAELAAKTSGDEQAEAREALASLHRGAVLDQIISQIKTSAQNVQLELVRALARRMDRRATPELLRLGSGPDAKLGGAAIKALEKVADDSHAAQLLDLVVRAKDDARQEAALSAFVNVASRSRNPSQYSGPALKAASSAESEMRCALLEAAGQIGGPGVIEALRAALKDADADVRDTALRTIAENATDEARPDLLELARTANDAAQRTQALQGYWRLVEGMSERPQAERLAAVRDGFAAAKTASEQKLGLSRLAELRGSEALALAQEFMRNSSVRAEAETACCQIASRLEAAQVALAEKTLRALAAEAQSQRVRTDAQEIVKQLEAQSGCLAPWLVCGPYRQKGKEAQALFDIAFAPEKPGAPKVTWHPLAAAGGLTDYWRLDLLPVAGGDQRVVYLKTKVFSPKEQPVALEIGTDDGVKLWINGGLVHANNAVRGFTPGEDKAKGTLKEGWNDFLVKVTQSTAGCAASVRVRAADGTPIPDLRVEARD